MIINTEKYVGIPYVFTQGPLEVPTLAIARQKGANCQALVQLALRDVGVDLPPTMMSYEIFHDTNHSRPLEESSPLHPGDVVVFGKGEDATKYHLTIYPGSDERENEPRLLHASYKDKMTTVWPLSRFAEESTKKLLVVKRFTQT